jgi:hypothetical protein
MNGFDRSVQKFKILRTERSNERNGLGKKQKPTKFMENELLASYCGTQGRQIVSWMKSVSCW